MAKFTAQLTFTLLILQQHYLKVLNTLEKTLFHIESKLHCYCPIAIYIMINRCFKIRYTKVNISMIISFDSIF